MKSKVGYIDMSYSLKALNPERAAIQGRRYKVKGLLLEVGYMGYIRDHIGFSVQGLNSSEGSIYRAEKRYY